MKYKCIWSSTENLLIICYGILETEHKVLFDFYFSWCLGFFMCLFLLSITFKIFLTKETHTIFSLLFFCFVFFERKHFFHVLQIHLLRNLFTQGKITTKLTPFACLESSVVTPVLVGVESIVSMVTHIGLYFRFVIKAVLITQECLVTADQCLHSMKGFSDLTEQGQECTRICEGHS